MDIGMVVLLTAFTVISLKGILYLRRYLLLLKFGVTLTGQIKSFDLFKSMLNKNAVIPKVFFIISASKEILGQPVLSFLYPVNNYAYKTDCIVMYDTAKPTRFVIKNSREPISNILFIIVTIGFWVYQLL